ncbi:transposase [Frankia sp. QA3]|uniref:transposase n=1 Tax=Frankia sp. QA3 TaxID=710111 RepID=UPI0012FAB6A0
MDGVCNAEYGEISPDRTKRRNGYRMREWAPAWERLIWRFRRRGRGSYFPEWLLTCRRRADQALISVVVTSNLLPRGSPAGRCSSTRYPVCPATGR